MGGLTSSMFLTIIVVPMMYYIVDRIKDKISAIKLLKKAKQIS
jgi:Cu/Ag efflux pump CusA